MREFDPARRLNMEGIQLMTDKPRDETTGATAEAARDNEENELEAEQESAEAMDAEAPQPDAAPQAGDGEAS